jgi:HlyD family secretion protein
MFIYNQFIKQPPTSVNVQQEVVKEETLFLEVSATGTINPVNMVDVGTQVSGQISEIMVDYNDDVKAGQVLAKMDMRNLRSSLKESKANLEKAKINMDQTKRSLDRTKELHTKELASELEIEQAQDAYNNAIATYNISKIQLEKNSVNLGYADIVSPIDGVVISKNAEVGQTVAATFSTPTLFTIANNMTEMKIEASVDEADIGLVKEFQKVVFTVDAFPEDEFTGVVAQVQLQPTIINNVVTYNVIILIQNPDLKLMPGMTATLIIQTKEKPNSITVPNSALAFDPSDADWKVLKKKKYKMIALEEENENTVWIKEDKTFKEVAVEVDFTNGIRSSIKGDIAVGDSVITNLKVKIGEEAEGSLFSPPEEDEEKE